MSVANQIHNPPLSLCLGHVQFISDHCNLDALVNTAISLKDMHAGIFQKLLTERVQEIIVLKQGLTLSQFLLSGFKVKLNEKSIHKLGDGVRVGVALLLDDLQQILHCGSLSLADDHGGGKVSEDVGAGGLDDGKVALVEKQFQQGISSIGMVEEDEETPMNQPGALLASHNGRSCFVIDQTLKDFEIRKSVFPLSHQNFGGKFPPEGVEGFVLIGGEVAEVTQKVSSGSIRTTAELKTSEFIETFQLILGNPIVSGEGWHIKSLLTNHRLSNCLRLVLGGDNQLEEGPGLLLCLRNFGDDLFSAFDHFLGGGFPMDFLVDFHGKVNHVGFGKEVELGFQHLFLGVNLFHFQELKQRKAQVSIQERANSMCVIILRGRHLFFFNNQNERRTRKKR
mmetsp:Transcript_3668/g.5568  ORF Transcript_3668/g.5568 Transcript_3668/m.5568 type:complete len:395 (+) Transcript_3668:347-1531(+)